MAYLITEIRVALTLLLVTSIGFVYGDYDYLPSYEINESCYSCQPVCCERGFISADALYWRAFESGLDTCFPVRTSETVASDGTVTSRFSGKSRDPHFRWDPGFRIGAGYAQACNGGWDIASSWTHFHSHANESRSDDDEVRWKINFDVIDIVAGYEADLGSCFSLRPFGGLRGAKIDQKLHRDEFPISTSSSIADAIHTSNKEKFSGLGPLIGLEANWDLCRGFSFFANASVSWLYGHFHVKVIESSVFVDASDFCKVRKHLDASLAAADAALGVRWQTCIFRNIRLILQLGLEHHRYFDYNRIGGYGDLSFDGVNFSVGIGF